MLEDLIDGGFTPNIVALAVNICSQYHLKQLVQQLRGRSKDEVQKEYLRLIPRINLRMSRGQLVSEEIDLCKLLALEIYLKSDGFIYPSVVLHDLTLAYQLMRRKESVPQWVAEWWSKVEQHLVGHEKGLRAMLLFPVVPKGLRQRLYGVGGERRRKKD